MSSSFSLLCASRYSLSKHFLFHDRSQPQSCLVHILGNFIRHVSPRTPKHNNKDNNFSHLTRLSGISCIARIDVNQCKLLPKKSCNQDSYSIIDRRRFSTHRNHNKPPLPKTFTKKYDITHTFNNLKDRFTYVKNSLSLDIWTINLLLVTFVAGPTIYNAMKSSPRTEDDYMFGIPVDDPVEHSVRILMELDSNESKLAADGVMQNARSSNVTTTLISPEEDAKRILNDLLASENLRNTVSRIAAGVIQSPPFQNACKVLVKNIWNDIVSDPETESQLVALVQNILHNKRVYQAMKHTLVQLINDEQVYAELTKLVIRLGEDRDVLEATQRLLTESAHRTLNDPDVLDHSMEFATEVVGDDVVQRTGGEALRNTVGYAVQPSVGALWAGFGSMIVAGAIYFYYLKRGGHDHRFNGSNDIRSPTNSSYSHFNTMNHIGKGDFNDSYPERAKFCPLFQSALKSMFEVTSYPVFLLGSIWTTVFSVLTFPRHIFKYCSEKIHVCVNYMTGIPCKILLGLTYFQSRVSKFVRYCFLEIHTSVSVSLDTLLSNFSATMSSLMATIISVSKSTKSAMNYIFYELYQSLSYGAFRIKLWITVSTTNVIEISQKKFQKCHDFWRYLTVIISNVWRQRRDMHDYLSGKGGNHG